MHAGYRCMHSFQIKFQSLNEFYQLTGGKQKSINVAFLTLHLNSLANRQFIYVFVTFMTYLMQHFQASR